MVRRRGRSGRLLGLGVVAALGVAACSDDGGSAAPTTAATTTRPAEPDALPAEPIELTFAAADGKPLDGLYYPAATNPAPLVVLLHWELGDMGEWYEVAPWLQNRGLANTFPFTAHGPWMDSSWFPPVPAEASYGVLIFSFRGCGPAAERGCTGWTPAEWLLDAQAALLQATTLEGVDPARVVAIGASIGADGAVDACRWLVEQQPKGCAGALTLSPGSYLGESFGDTVAALGTSSSPTPVWCLAASPQEVGLCEAAPDNTAYQAFAIEGATHGMGLIDPASEPSTPQLLLDFLAATTGS